MAVSTASYPDRSPPVSIRVSLRACCTDYAAQIAVHVARDEPQGLFRSIGGGVLRPARLDRFPAGVLLAVLGDAVSVDFA